MKVPPCLPTAGKSWEEARCGDEVEGYGQNLPFTIHNPPPPYPKVLKCDII